MDLEARKYHFIQELFNIDSERIIETLERVLKHEKEQNQEISSELKKELDSRLKSYNNNTENILDWENVKNDW